MPRGILQGDHIEMIIGKGQGVDITDGAVDMHAELVRRFLPHPLHGLAAVHGINLQVRLLFKECYANGVGASTNIQYSLPTLHLYGGDSAVAYPVPETEGGYMISAVVITGNILTDIIQFFYPN